MNRYYRHFVDQWDDLSPILADYHVDCGEVHFFDFQSTVNDDAWRKASEKVGELNADHLSPFLCFDAHLTLKRFDLRESARTVNEESSVSICTSFRPYSIKFFHTNMSKWQKDKAFIAIIGKSRVSIRRLSYDGVSIDAIKDELMETDLEMTGSQLDCRIFDASVVTNKTYLQEQFKEIGKEELVDEDKTYMILDDQFENQIHVLVLTWGKEHEFRSKNGCKVEFMTWGDQIDLTEDDKTSLAKN